MGQFIDLVSWKNFDTLVWTPDGKTSVQSKEYKINYYYIFTFGYLTILVSPPYSGARSICPTRSHIVWVLILRKLKWLNLYIHCKDFIVIAIGTLINYGVLIYDILSGCILFLLVRKTTMVMINKTSNKPLYINLLQFNLEDINSIFLSNNFVHFAIETLFYVAIVCEVLYQYRDFGKI